MILYKRRCVVIDILFGLVKDIITGVRQCCDLIGHYAVQNEARIAWEGESQ